MYLSVVVKENVTEAPHPLTYRTEPQLRRLIDKVVIILAIGISVLLPLPLGLQPRQLELFGRRAQLPPVQQGPEVILNLQRVPLPRVAPHRHAIPVEEELLVIERDVLPRLAGDWVAQLTAEVGVKGVRLWADDIHLVEAYRLWVLAEAECLVDAYAQCVVCVGLRPPLQGREHHHCQTLLPVFVDEVFEFADLSALRVVELDVDDQGGPPAQELFYRDALLAQRNLQTPDRRDLVVFDVRRDF
mmetsp:Transcript_35825/g.89215  ORF Transcript_35825/g.89215 Transcript_35825/m.89215 type:complete len:244 (+) Transcript_35825:313-1044(+)